MAASGVSKVSEVFPQEAAKSLAETSESILVDVRTRPEWQFVGLPDLSASGKDPVLLEWQVYPTMAPRSDFAEVLLGQFQNGLPSDIFFLCRSGVRSLYAAEAVASTFTARGEAVNCVNVIGGFEGDPDPSGHRGVINGWKAAGLPWRQS